MEPTANLAAPTESGGRVTASIPDERGPAGIESPEPGESPSPSPGPSPGGDPADPTASPSPGATCPYGKGSIDTTCLRHGAPAFLADVDAAINAAVRERPELFDLAADLGGGSYRVLEPEAFIGEVVGNLREAAYCAEFDGSVVQMKNSNDFSESYDVLISNGHIRRGVGSYRSTCAPAAFPVDPRDHLDSVRVSFFGFKCPDGVTPPRNGAGELPVGCTGYVTATPKDKENKDVPSHVHGPEIHWDLVASKTVLRMDHVEGQPFNQELFGVGPGEFRLCATVLEVEGCLNGRVTPPE